MPRPLGNKSTRQTRVKKLAPKKTKSEKKAERAARKPGGLTGALVLMGTLLAAGIAAAIGLEKKDKKKSDEILQRLLSKPLVKSEHAYCRMDCRHISNEEVEHALHHGRVDKPRSEFKAKPCPKIAVKGTILARAYQTHTF